MSVSKLEMRLGTLEKVVDKASVEETKWDVDQLRKELQAVQLDIRKVLKLAQSPHLVCAKAEDVSKMRKEVSTLYKIKWGSLIGLVGLIISASIAWGMQAQAVANLESNLEKIDKKIVTEHIENKRASQSVVQELLSQNERVFKEIKEEIRRIK